MDISEAYEEVPEFKQWCDKNNRTYTNANKIKGLVKNKGVHPSAILLSYDNITKSCPLEFDSDKEIISSFNMDWSQMFNVKLDVLGLRTVSVVDQACKIIGIKVGDIDLNHESIYQSLYDLKHPQGIFQIEARAAYEACKKGKAEESRRSKCGACARKTRSFSFR